MRRPNDAKRRGMIKGTTPTVRATDLLLALARELLDSVDSVKRTCSKEDGIAYSRAVRHILCTLFAKVVCVISEADPIPVPDAEEPMRRIPMLSDAATAERVSTLMREVSERLASFSDVAQSALSDEAFGSCVLGVGETLTDIMYEVMHPIYERHPALKPESWP